MRRLYQVTSKSWGDLKKQADDASRPVPKDWYDVIITKADLTTASTGSLMIKAQLKIVGGPYNNRMLFTNFVLSTENSIALSIFFRNMSAFGLDDAFFASLAGADADPEVGMQTVAQTLVGRVARADVGIRTWQGQERNEVGQFARQTNTPIGGPVMPTSASSAPTPIIPTGVNRVSSGTAASVPPVPQVAAPVSPPVTSAPVVPTVTPSSAPPEIPAF